LGSSMMRLLDRLSLSSTMLLAVGGALVAVATSLISYDITAKHRDIEVMAERRAEAALDMLEAVHIQSMIYRGQVEDGDPAINTLNKSMEQFSRESQSVDLWLVTGPKVLAFQKTNNQQDIARPIDAVDATVIKTAKPMRALTAGDVLRVTRPVIMGEGHARHERCAQCHTRLMGIGVGEVIGAYSAAVDLRSELAGWRQGIILDVTTAAAITVLTLALIFSLLKFAALRPLQTLAGITHRLANGDAEVEIKGQKRIDEFGMMARSLDVFRANLIEKKCLEAEQAAMLHVQEEQKLRLEAALDKERELSGLQRQFVSMVSHEFRTPLAIIDGSAQRLIRRPDKITPDRLHKGLHKIRTSVFRLIDLMESVLSVSRLESGTIRFEPHPCNIIDMIQEVCANHQELSATHEVVAELGELPQTVSVDLGLMRQVASNLISNAIKYSPAGKRIWVSGGMTSDGDVTISVRDEGPGIPSDELEKLFDRFFRGSTSTGIIGTGIGLHIVQVFIEMHGGHVKVSSTLDEGTTFIVFLPSSIPELTRDAEAA